MPANNTQIGGDHYRREYQHWDWVTDNKIPYLLAVATKYPTRWMDKNGVEDLKKSVHYLEKAIEKEVVIPNNSLWDRVYFKLVGWNLPSEILKNTTRLFTSQLPKEEKEIITLISQGKLQLAIGRLKELISSHEEGPGPHYIKG